jgi:hypothetical protein
MFGGFTTRNNFGSTSGHFPTRPLGNLGNFNTYAGNFIIAANITVATQQAAIYKLCDDLTNSGLMDKMIAVYPFVGGNATSHTFNLKDPRDSNNAYRLTFSGGWTHSSNGIQGNGTNTYATTYLLASTAPFPQTNCHISCYSRTSTVPGSTFEVSVDNGSNFNQIAVARNFFSGGNVVNTGGVNFTTTTNSSGFWCGSKTSTSERFGTRNGILNTAVSSNTDATLGASFSFTIGSRNNSNVISAYSSKELAFVSIGLGLSQAEHATLYTIVQTFQTTLGRNV